VRPQKEPEHAGSVRSQEAIPGRRLRARWVRSQEEPEHAKTSKTTFREDGGIGREAMR